MSYKGREKSQRPDCSTHTRLCVSTCRRFFVHSRTSASPVEFPSEASGRAKSARHINQISAVRVSASGAGYGCSFFHRQPIFHLLYKGSDSEPCNLQFTKDYKPASHLIGGVRFQPAWRLQPEAGG